ncbi:MAG: hypothetical protein G8D61_04565 [gamma proteobacterium symbiont of Ctena orbiculata]|nr:hypothetical protein [Candidatus Thiodiazotropha taylori]MBT3060962.1 hypothetical protein [Candidatus Thiodiazotropha sp. (ex Lucina pensylvanica)]MBV2094423.1 hypothetical protein [Candidatus Thiodiazotropha sp. (ex Codakia orbicularis)]PUB78258.1 MAG: hypothetical protein DBP03_01400 [gamma proteobacterium symbiont of Ctena orbiculata]MBT3062238.1 hypothetical protein [Candidatus Thiodiazotropha sp. (ex Lucina pensylvanica)]
MSMKEAVQQIGEHANMMPMERGITLPMIKVENNRVIVRRLIYFTRTTPEYGTAITEPQYVAIYDLSAAAFLTLKRFEMEVPNLKPPPWIHNRPAFDKPEDIIPEFDRIWTLYDMLIPAFLNPDAGISEEIKQAAKAYVHYFDRHAEKPLLPFYDLFGGDFLRWVGQVANS